MFPTFMFPTLAQAATLAQNDAPPPPNVPDAGDPAAPGAGGDPNQAQTLQPANGDPAAGPVEGQDGGGGGGGGAFAQLLFFVAIIGIFWFVLIRGQRKEKKKREQMLSAIKKGDRVTTIGGIIGTLTDVRDDEVTIKVDENSNVKMKFSRSAIQSVLSEKSSPES